MVRSTYVYVHTCLEEECRIINQSGSCTLRPLRLLHRCIPLNQRQISSDITSSPLFATATKTYTSKGRTWRLNKSACNSASNLSPTRNSACSVLFYTPVVQYPGYGYLCRVPRGTGEVHARARCFTRTLNTTLKMYTIVLYECMQYTTFIVLTSSSVQCLYPARPFRKFCRKSIPVPDTSCTFCTKLTT